MIYTCTTNPSLDYYLTFDEIKMGTYNRSDSGIFDAGGKGVNVSIVLNNFRIPTSCLGFLGGFTKDYYLSFLANYPNIQPLFTNIKGNTRINVKLMDSKQETSLNLNGPSISEDEFNKFKSRLMNIYGDDIFVLSGSIQDEIEDKMVDLINELSRENIRTILDTEPLVTDRLIDTKPFMIKLNDNYLNNSSKSLQEISEDMISRGVKYVLYSSPLKESYLFTKDITLKCDSLNDGLVNTTGSADSMVAGFIYGIIRGGDIYETFKYANAASLATTLSNDLGSKEKIEEVFNTIEVIKV